MIYIKNINETKDQLIKELAELCRKVVGLKASGEKEERLDFILDALPLPVFYVDLEQSEYFSNQAHKEWFDCSVKEMREKDIREILIQQFYQKNQIFEGLLSHKDGQTRSVNFIYVPHFNKLGKIKGFAVIVSDITERKKAEEELRMAEKQFLKIFHSSPNSMYIITLEKGRYVDANECHLGKLGYFREEIIGRTVEDINILVDKNEYYKMLEALREQGRIGSTEYLFRKKTGNLAKGLLSAELINLGGEICVLCTVSDIADRKKMEDAFKNLEEEYRTIFENTGTATAIVNEDTTISLVNHEFENLLGYSKEEIEGKRSWTEFIVKDDLERTKKFQLRRRIDPDTAPGNLEFRFIDKKGDVKNIFMTIATIPGTKKSAASLVDITGRKQTEAALKIGEERFRLLAGNTRDIIYRIRLLPDQKFDYISPAIMDITGYTPEELQAEPSHGFRLVHPDDRYVFRKIITGDSDYSKPIIVRWVTKGGQIIWVELRNTPIFNNCGNLIAIEGGASDLTGYIKIKEQLKHLKHHDSLTGLFNRAYFKEEMRLLDSVCQDSAGLIVCDIDGFKIINDTFGHLAGDELLIAAANILKKCFRENDTISRTGNDEFAVILPNCSLPAIRSAYRRIQATIAEYNDNNPKVCLSISIGYSLNDGTKTMDELFKEADYFLRREKLLNSKGVYSAAVENLMKMLQERDFENSEYAQCIRNLVLEIAAAAGLPDF